ncbi:hypothetical protein SAMN05877831_102292 [Rhodobacter maris]|uniref:Uncharacterized protein n=1 Tax=Rhodobacter maris TaxID=446682 RepID=A0A285S020_9RHOB|nr:hypothetical protein SAMN05877831_102292 [Rhodobacter maris]
MVDYSDVNAAPIWVAGKGLAHPPGWIGPETRALMRKAQEDCDAYEASKQGHSTRSGHRRVPMPSVRIHVPGPKPTFCCDAYASRDPP